MKKHIKTVAAHPLISGGTLVFFSGFASNILNYLFNLAMGRTLSNEEYGLMYSLISAIGFFSIFQSTLQGIFIKYSAKYHANNDIQNIKKIFWAGLKLQILLSGILSISVVFLSPFIADFLHVDDSFLIVILAIYLFFSLLYTLPSAILQGQLRILLYSIGTIMGPLIKLSLGLFFVALGFAIYGVMGAFVASALIPFVFLFLSFFIKFGKKIESFSIKELIVEVRRYSLGYFLASLGFSFFSFADVLLVRHFLPDLSGEYAALSVMGKAIFYFISPIYIVFFPLIAQKKEKKEKLLGTLLLACFVIVISSIGMSFVYFLFPALVVNIFFPNPEYKILTHFLGIYSLYIMVFSLVSLFHNYFLSVGRMGIYKIILIVSGVLVGGIWFYHQTLYQVIGVLFASTFALLVCYLIYYLIYERD